MKSAQGWLVKSFLNFKSNDFNTRFNTNKFKFYEPGTLVVFKNNKIGLLISLCKKETTLLVNNEIYKTYVGNGE